jgi:dipeptidyl aminopeptidase/acylaminoacyl peptidase
MQVVGFDWLPDSRGIAFTHRPLPEWEHWQETRLATVTVDAGHEVTDLGLVGDWTARPLVSPDGRWVACHSSDRPGKWALSGRVVLYPVAPAGGSGAPGEVRTLAETPDGKCDPVCWAPAGDEVYVLQQSGVSPQLWALPASGAPARPVTSGTLVLGSAAGPGGGADGAVGTVACVGQDLHKPNAVYHVEPGTDATRLAAAPRLPEDWPVGAPPEAEVVRWTSGDGRQIEGILVYPLGQRLRHRLGQRPGTPWPLVVEAHGGPPSAFSRGYVLAPDRTVDSAALAARGYAVLRPNPRGSTGYGPDFRFANYGDWGGGDLDDILAGIDWLIQEGIADGERLGIAGWSYGGYLTAAAITRTDRFKGACVGAGITNPASFNGTSDVPDFIPDYLGAEAWDDPERYRRHSPVLNAGAIRTPTLILHGEEDERVPTGQGRELHNALRRRGVPVELVLYPRQGHAIGEPRLQLDARRRIVEWMERWV